MTTNKREIEVLQDPSLNKSTAFTEAEKQALGIVGLVPDVTETEDLQLSRVMMQLGHKNTDLERYIYLINLLLAQKSWIVPIPGTTKLQRLDENIGAVALELTSDDLREIESAASKITIQGARYPEHVEQMTGR